MNVEAIALGDSRNKFQNENEIDLIYILFSNNFLIELTLIESES